MHKQTTRAVVVCPIVKAEKRQAMREPQARLEEAVNLTQAIHLEIVQGLIFQMSEIKPATVLGAGQVEHIAEVVKAHDIHVVVIDCSLTPMQQRNLERALAAKVIDRNALILEIFGDRAQTKEGKLQVELAALDYQKSRLVRSWTHLERQRGGFGFMGGPGESQIETDRRLIKERIAVIKEQLEKVVQTRGLHRKGREAVPFPTVALVGYTNAGKSSVFNRLTDARVLAEDALFATLDPTTRKVRLPSGMDIILSDTVGFISNLPTQLIAAFRATLEEVRQADLLVHVRDITHRDSHAQKQDVLAVLSELFGSPEDVPPMLEVWNKCDVLHEDDPRRYGRDDDVWRISAHTGEGMEALLVALEHQLSRTLFHEVCYDVAHSDGRAQAWLHRHGIIRHIEQFDGVVRITVGLSDASMGKFYQEFHLRPYQVYSASII
ncbi:MAG: GTPase HflX [Alphaproteobacteria bacterium]|nr:MAG: GTPase HflX [Alphaproteobacteria bacterium]TAF40298.1 MAG: GTPase HflX [Alphaproteobacteria bacterium]TAF75285.1 MAG: GTPase HflX [Alphaproteobacteria bacterium]